jgi:glucosamine--fructose-6-phosphate aminotransferase (isomerizing)
MLEQLPETPADVTAAVDETIGWSEARTGAAAIAAALVVAREAGPDVVDRLAFADRIVITGAGSSYYIAQIAAAAMRSLCGLPAVAVPLSEVLLRPAEIFALDDYGNQPLLVVSRSGTTTEALDVVDAARAREQHTLAITCRPGSELAAAADSVLAVPEADEEGIVMTRSFAAMTAMLMRLGTRLGTPTFTRDLERLPALWPETAPHVERAFEVASSAPTRVVVLGGGAAFGLANEAMLKITETSQTPASAYHPLEFRHGPISVCEPGMLVVGLLGGPNEAIERRVLEEAAALGATTWALGPDGPGADVDHVARLPLLLHPLQALALGLAVRTGKDPDAPRHLSQVVTLGA